MLDELQRRWRGEQCPIGDAVVFADGRVVKVDYPQQPRDLVLFGSKRPKPLVLDIVSESDLTTVLGPDGDRWAYNVERHSVAAERGVRFSCGETSWGSEGYVACSAGADDLLLWIAVFEGSNPFERLHLDASFVAARSSHGTWWTFLRAAPTRIELFPSTVGAGWLAFARSAFEFGDALPDGPPTESLADDLGRMLRERLGPHLDDEKAFREAVGEILDQLSAVGHELYSFDDDGDGNQAWRGDWTNPPDRELTLTFGRGGPDAGPTRAIWSPGSSERRLADTGPDGWLSNRGRCAACVALAGYQRISRPTHESYRDDAVRLHGALEEIEGSETEIGGGGFRRKYRCKQCAHLWLLEVLFDHGSESIEPLSSA